jgi:hypothetical protein
MDTISHGIWAFILFFRNPLRWYALVIAMLPDILVGIPHMLFDHHRGHSQVVFDTLYQYTHSLFLFAIVFAVIYYFSKPIAIISLAWPLHSVLDIFTHPASYYPTPYLFPFYSPFMPAIDYRSFWFKVFNFSLIVIVLIYLNYKYQPRKKKSVKKKHSKK